MHLPQLFSLLPLRRHDLTSGPLAVRCGTNVHSPPLSFFLSLSLFPMQIHRRRRRRPPPTPSPRVARQAAASPRLGINSSAADRLLPQRCGNIVFPGCCCCCCCCRRRRCWDRCSQILLQQVCTARITSTVECAVKL